MSNTVRDPTRHVAYQLHAACSVHRHSVRLLRDRLQFLENTMNARNQHILDRFRHSTLPLKCVRLNDDPSGIDSGMNIMSNLVSASSERS